MNTHHTSLQAITRYTILAISCAVFLALIVTLLKLCHKKQNEPTSLDNSSSDPIASGSSTDNVKNSSILHQQADFHPLTELEIVTDGFHPSRIIGSGVLGTVYIATSPLGILIAVKRIHPHLVLSNPGLSFASRMHCLSLHSHPNIVPILGYAEAPGERIIISKLVPTMKTLDSYLNEEGDLLGWHLRLCVAAGVARGLEHLHEANILHGRLKASNVMIDSGFCARVCDYCLGFVKEGGKEEGKEGDVYDFGVVILEIMSGKKGSEGVVDWAMPLIRKGRVREIVDPRIGTKAEEGFMVRAAKVAAACVGNGRRSRPEMKQVAAILNELEIESWALNGGPMASFDFYQSTV